VFIAEISNKLRLNISIFIIHHLKETHPSIKGQKKGLLTIIAGNYLNIVKGKTRIFVIARGGLRSFER